MSSRQTTAPTKQATSKAPRQQQQQRDPPPAAVKRSRKARDEEQQPPSPHDSADFSNTDDIRDGINPPTQSVGAAVSNPGSSVDAILRNASASGEGLPPSKFVKLAESQHIIYDFDKFDPKNVVWSNKVYSNTQGEMYYVNYTYPDGIVGPLLINTCCLRSAKGYQEFTDANTNKVSHIVFGSIERNEHADAFVELLHRYDECTKNLIKEKRWCGNKDVALEDIGTALLPCISQGMSDQGVAYPPSFKMQVCVDDPRNRTKFFIEPSLIRVPPERLQPTNFFTAVVQFRWVFRKKQGDRKAYPLGFSFSNNVSMTQVVIHAGDENDDDVCQVRLPAKSLAAPVVAAAAGEPTDGDDNVPPQLPAAPMDPAPGVPNHPKSPDDTVGALNALPSPVFQKHIVLSSDLPPDADYDSNMPDAAAQ